MNFSEANGIHGGLPQFSEITTKSGRVYSSSELEAMQQTQNIIYTTAAAASINQGKQTMVSQQNKYPSGVTTWADTNTTIVQLCDKQTINIPNYNNQNNSTIVGVQANGLPIRLIPNVYLAQGSQVELPQVKQEPLLNTNLMDSSMASQIQLQQQSAVMAEYLQKLQATSLPLQTLQQIMKFQSEPASNVKREKIDEESGKGEHQQTNNILNIPSVPAFRNGHMTHNGMHSFMNIETGGGNTMMEINPNDLNIHMEDSDESPDCGRQTQTDDTRTENQSEFRPGEQGKGAKKMKFRAKIGEIKINVGLDGTLLYCCPTCNLGFSEKADIEQHIQCHVQERKYECKQCGAMLKRKEHLDQHMRGHSDERPFKCPSCQKAFKRNEHLTRHYVIHSGNKNFTCTVCEKAFSRKDHLNKHTQTHLGIKRSKASKKEQRALTGTTKDLAHSVPSPDEDTLLMPKQEFSFLQHIHQLQKDQNFIQTFSAFKEQALRENAGVGVGGDGSTSGVSLGMLQQQAVNMSEILPQNVRYLMPP